MPGKPLDTSATEALLASAEIGRLATVDADGFPYVVPVQFAWHNGRGYIHGRNGGEKLGNLLACSKVGFEIDAPGSLRVGKEPCNTSTNFSSVIIRGIARIADSLTEKEAALDLLVAKYVPQHTGKAYPDAMLEQTVVIVIEPESCTGKCNSAA